MRHGTIFRPDWRVKAYCLGARLRVPADPGRHVDAHRAALHRPARRCCRCRNVKRKVAYLGDARRAGAGGDPVPAVDLHQPHEHHQDLSTRTNSPRRGSRCGNGRSNTRRRTRSAGASTRISATTSATDLKTTPGAAEAPKVEVDKARAYHSAYFEMLGEQGYPGLAIWLAINLIGIVRMEFIRRRYRDPDGEFAWAGPLAARCKAGTSSTCSAQVHRDRLPAVHLHADRRADRPRHVSRAQAERAIVPADAPQCRAISGVTDRTPVHELRALTGVRGIAAWFVVFYHIRLSIAGLPTGVRDVFAKGLSGGRLLLPAVRAS